MRVLPTRIHGIVDWLLGALLIALPWLLGSPRGGPETSMCQSRWVQSVYW